MAELQSTRRQLEAGGVHLWTHHQPATGCAANVRLLSDVERQRAARFQFPHLSAAFIDIHGWMRRVLASYTAADPASLVFRYNDFGKPALAPPQDSLSFNLSHTTGLALLAVAHRVTVGVDVEAVRPVEEAAAIASTHFSVAERQALRVAPPTEQEAVFFRCWTRKEALLKAWGTGISTNLAAFSVSTADDSAALLHCDWDSQAPLRWTLTPLQVGAEYIAALAIDGPARTLCYRNCLESAC